MRWVAACLLVAHMCCASRTLVLLDSFDQVDEHSIFLRNLKSHGHELTFSLADDQALTMKRHGEWLYDSMLLLCPAVQELGGEVDVDVLLDFVDGGHGGIVAASPDIGGPMRTFAEECGVLFDSVNHLVVDHFAFDTSDVEHASVVLGGLTANPLLVGDTELAPVLYRGIGHSVDDTGLLLSIADASDTSYSHAPEAAAVAGPRGRRLLSALQARNNARVLFSGSLEMFSDAVYQRAPSVVINGKAKKWKGTGNHDLVEELCRWTFRERGVVEVTHMRHAGEDGPRDMYTIGDTMDFEVSLRSWESSAGWSPFVTDDVQLEVKMMNDVRARAVLTHRGGGVYSASLTLPEVFGVYTLEVPYAREGYTRLGNNSVTVSVRPRRHDAFERFIPPAYPYYASALSTLGAFFFLSVALLLHK